LWGTNIGFTFWPFIFIVKDKDRSANRERTLIEHEKIHIKQQLRGLLIIFYLRYLYYHFTVGYDKNPFEVYAYKHQEDWKNEVNN